MKIFCLTEKMCLLFAMHLYQVKDGEKVFWALLYKLCIGFFQEVSLECQYMPVDKGYDPDHIQ